MVQMGGIKIDMRERSRQSSTGNISKDESAPLQSMKIKNEEILGHIPSNTLTLKGD